MSWDMTKRVFPCTQLTNNNKLNFESPFVLLILCLCVCFGLEEGISKGYYPFLSDELWCFITWPNCQRRQELLTVTQQCQFLIVCKYQSFHQGVLCSTTNYLSWGEKKQKNKKQELRGGRRSVAVCCCPWYWNQPAAHPVTTSIPAAFTLFLPWHFSVNNPNQALCVTACKRWLCTQPSCRMGHDASIKTLYSLICNLWHMVSFLKCMAGE